MHYFQLKVSIYTILEVLKNFFQTDELDHDLTAIDTSDISFSETLQASGPQIILKISIPEQTFTVNFYM